VSNIDNETLLLAIRFGHCSAVHAATLREAGGAWAVEAVRENEALRAEIKRLRAIEAAARDAMRQIDRALWDTGCLHDLRNNARICDLRAALAAKENGK
jgi:hypothetical protein